MLLSLPQKNKAYMTNNLKINIFEEKQVKKKEQDGTNMLHDWT